MAPDFVAPDFVDPDMATLGRDGSLCLMRTMPRVGVMAPHRSKAGFDGVGLGMAMALVRDWRSHSRAMAGFRVMGLGVIGFGMKGFCRMALGVRLVGAGLMMTSLMVMSLKVMRSHTCRRRRNHQRGDHRRHNQLQPHCLQSPFRKNHIHPGAACVRGAAGTCPLS